MITGLLSAVSTLVVAILGWAVRTEQRMSVLETRLPDLREILDTRLEAIEARLARIERSLNGHP